LVARLKACENAITRSELHNMAEAMLGVRNGLRGGQGAAVGLNAIIQGMPKVRKPMPAMYAPKEPSSTRINQEATTRVGQAARPLSQHASSTKPSTDASGVQSRAKASRGNTRDSLVGTGTVHSKLEATSQVATDSDLAVSNPVDSENQSKEVQPVAFCANGFLLANVQRLEDTDKLEVKLESGMGFIGTPSFPFSKRLARAGGWPSGRSRVGLFPRTDSHGRLLGVQQVNAVRTVLDSHTISSSFHLVGLPVDTRGLLTVRIYPQRLGLNAFNVIVHASSDLLEVANIAGEARNGVEVLGEIVERDGGLELMARTVVGLRLVIPRHHLPGFKPGKPNKPARNTRNDEHTEG
jgi:hypothetical protein